MNRLLALLTVLACLHSNAQGLRSPDFLSMLGNSNPGPSWTGGWGGGGGGPSDGYEANLISYYKCDDTLTVGGFVVDSVAGANLQEQFGNPQSMTGILGNALDTRGSDDGGDQWLLPSPSSHFALSGHSWTVRYWVYPTSEAGGDDLASHTPHSSATWRTGYDGGDQFFLKVVHNCAPFGTTLTISSAHGYAINQWHRVIVWHDLGVQFGIQVDNDTPVTSSQTYDICSDGGTEQLNIVDSFLGIDEIAIWKDYVLTSDDRLFDWNSGAGRTYPLP